MATSDYWQINIFYKSEYENLEVFGTKTCENYTVIDKNREEIRNLSSSCISEISENNEKIENFAKDVDIIVDNTLQILHDEVSVIVSFDK